MGPKLVTIQVDAASPKTVFHVISPTGPARILMLGVSPAHLRKPTWEITTRALAGTPTYTATAQIILESEQVLMPLDGSELEGEHWDWLASVEDNREVLSVTYGEVPTGFQQTHPEQRPPSPLDPGTRYKVAVMGACIGEAVFIA
jgi:hypothetical protein